MSDRQQSGCPVSEPSGAAASDSIVPLRQHQPALSLASGDLRAEDVVMGVHDAGECLNLLSPQFLGLLCEPRHADHVSPQ